MTEQPHPGPAEAARVVRRLSRAVIAARRLSRQLVLSFLADNGPQNAASLAFTTLLSLVPLMTIVVALLAAFPASKGLSDQTQAFIFENLIPEFGHAESWSTPRPMR